MGLRRDIGVIAVGLVVVAGGCGGPLDSPDPPVVRDAGTDVRPDLSRDRGGAGGRRATDGAADAPDAGIDGPQDAPWPVIPGCVTGLPPQPTFTTAIDGGVIVVGCAELSRTIVRVGDSSHHGFLLNATFDPLQVGIDLSYPSPFCADEAEMPINLLVSGAAGLIPGQRFSTTLRTQVLGPLGPQDNRPVRLDMMVAPVDFRLDTDLVDFGVVTLGEFRSVTVTAINSPAGAPFMNLYGSPYAAAPFFLSGPTMGADPQAVLEPGASLPLLTVALYAATPGSFQSSFLISPFQTGVSIDPSCGVIRSLTVRAQIVFPDAGVPTDGPAPRDARSIPDAGDAGIDADARSPD